MKPVKGLEAGFGENVESFFALEYPCYELLFSVADVSDPAIPCIQSLIEKYPGVAARLLIGDVQVGANPKVNNLIRPYAEARYDWILISDSNIRVESDYLQKVAAEFTSEVGIVSAIVVGRAPSGIGGWLESTFLNSFYARWMVLSGSFGHPVVIGKSMLFRKSEARRFGGLEQLGRYLAEDYMAGQAMQFLGKRIVLMRQPVSQPIGEYSMRSFWARHIRWGRIRKSQAPVAFLFEPCLSSSWLSGLIGVLSAGSLFGSSRLALLGAHFLIWLTCDLALMKALKEPIRLRSVLAWFARETLHPVLWLHIASGNTVVWRGRVLSLSRGGVLKAS